MKTILKIVATVFFMQFNIAFSEMTHSKKNEIVHKNDTIPLYSYWMWYLKSREGYIPHMYRCPAGIRTIGYRHNLEAHKYPVKKIVSYNEATLLLLKDSEKQLFSIKKQFPHLTKAQLYAVTSLCLNCGENRVKYSKHRTKSNFWKSLENKQTPNFLKYVYYKNPQGVVIKSLNLVQSRKFEQEMFNGNFVFVEKEGLKYRNIVINRDIKLAKSMNLYN